MNGMKALADELVSALPVRLAETLDEARCGIWSVLVCGSYVRGDFVSRNSDLDFVIILQPGHGRGEFPLCDASSEPGFQAVRSLLGEMLAGRRFYGHSPQGFDVVPLRHDWIPTTSKDVVLPSGPANLRYLNLFIFDFLENIQVLWGEDPRDIMPSAYDFMPLAKQWFLQSPNIFQTYASNGDAARCAFRAFISLQVAQVVFGKRTIDKREIGDLYAKYVPDFPMKEFGSRIIEEKHAQRFPSRPPRFASCEEYATFDEQLGRLVCDHLELIGQE